MDKSGDLMLKSMQELMQHGGIWKAPQHNEKKLPCASRGKPVTNVCHQLALTKMNMDNQHKNMTKVTNYPKDHGKNNAQYF